MPSHAHVIRVLIALGLIIPVASVFIRAGHLLCAGLPGTFLPFSLQISIVVFSLMPAGILAGYLFRLAAKQYGAEGGNLALAYGIESLGGVFGGVAATISMSIGIQNFFSACLCALFAVIIAWLTADSKRFHAKKGGLVSVLLCLCLIMLLFESGRIDRITEKLRHPNLLETRDIPYGRITITGQLDQYSVFLNNMLVWETGGTSAEEFIHHAMLQHPAPESVLLLGGSFAGLLKEILQHGPAEVICWELDKGLIDLVRRTLPTNLTESLDNPEVNIIHGDIRGLLRGDEKWDIILIGMADPGSSQGGRFYTQEFFSLCAESLNPGGIIALRLRTSENYWTPHFQELFRGIYNALKGEFQFIIVLPGGMSEKNSCV